MKRSKFYSIVVAIVRPFFFLIYPYKIINYNKVKSNRGFILASNHLSITDPFYLIIAMKNYSVNFMAKIELFSNKFMKWFLPKMGAFPVERGSGDMSTIEYAEHLIENNQILGIFPEGTRSKDGNIGRGRSGVAMIAGATKSDVMPVRIIPKTKDNKVHPFHKTYIVFGDMIKFEELGIEKNAPSEFRTASRLIMERIAGLKEDEG
jgi:1-acyl-sn-glycerol-3-phosphate acyltransferase